MDPNKTHPLLRKNVVQAVGNDLRGIKFTTYTFDAIIWKLDAKNNDVLCWENKNTRTFQYSHQLVSTLKALTAKQINNAIDSYKQHQREKRQKSKRG